MVLEESFFEQRLLAQSVYEFFILKDTAKLEWRSFSCEGALPRAAPEMKVTHGGKNMDFQVHVQIQIKVYMFRFQSWLCHLLPM